MFAASAAHVHCRSPLPSPEPTLNPVGCDSLAGSISGNKPVALRVKASNRSEAALRLLISVIMAVGWALVGDAVHQVRFALRHLSHYEL